MTGYKFGDVVLIDFLQATGDKKRHPANIILDTGDADIVLAPITTKERNGQGDYKLKDWNKSGLLRESCRATSGFAGSKASSAPTSAVTPSDFYF